ncbi:ferritin-like domain-containing protein [Methanofollis fontis]|uniref:Ferritin n=1 Tax=Methanofollis fontis TaxID=2052832 RepID=A0A483CRY4_9EURY|nr:ferritin family protein [Methanofollis fontis]TAJ44021.1 ferritin [Methanofollis fontis]
MKMEEYRKIIAQAIDKEVEAFVFYRSVYEKVKDENLKKIFSELADEEKEHRQILEGYLSGGAEALRFDESRDYKISQTIERPNPTVDMKPIEGIEMAIKREEDAMEMYEQFADLSMDADQKKVFTELANMERGHKARLEDLYTGMAFPEVW